MREKLAELRKNDYEIHQLETHLRNAEENRNREFRKKRHIEETRVWEARVGKRSQ